MKVKIFKNIKYKIGMFVILVFGCIFSNNTQVKAVKITAPSQVNIGDKFNVTVDFETYIAAFDRFELKYNSIILKNNSELALIENLWWDTSMESKGINKRVYSFEAIGNGLSTFNVDVKGLVSANDTLDALGDVKTNKQIKIGDGSKILGDVDGDGVVNANDAAIVLSIYNYGNVEFDDVKHVADIDNDGIINANDAALILKIYNYGY